MNAALWMVGIHIAAALWLLPAPSHAAVLSPAYFGAGEGYKTGELLATLSLTGLANRNNATLWLNSSAPAWRTATPVMWSYPQADETWLSYLKESKGLDFERTADAKLCTLLTHPSIRPAVKGIVLYEDSAVLDALKWAAVSAGGIHDSVPVTAAMRHKHSCLAALPVALTLPAASTFANDLAVYSWALEHLLPLSSTKILVGACDNWANYTCGWGDPLGTATVDLAVAKKSMVINLSPDTVKHPDQADMFSKFAAHLEPLGAFSGWAEPESDMVALLSKKDGVVVCGAPNLSFLSALEVATARLPHHREPVTLDKTKIYVSFQSNEGDTPKNAYSFRMGNWLLDKRGSVPMGWGSAPVIADLFPGLWEYYALTARSGDQFFGATGGAGYTYPWSLPDPKAYFQRVESLNQQYMPADVWEDVWDGGCPQTQGVPTSAVGQNPCLPMYQLFEKSAASIGGFSQWCSSCNKTTDPHAVYNAWLPDGTPVFGQPAALWYPQEKGFCNRTDGGHGIRPSASSLRAQADCIEGHLRTIAAHNPSRPLFVPAYGVDNYVDMAIEMKSRLSGADFVVIGAQDLSVLGRAAAPAAAASHTVET